MNKIRRMLVAKKTETNGGSSMSIDKRKALIGVMIVIKTFKAACV